MFYLLLILAAVWVAGIAVRYLQGIRVLRAQGQRLGLSEGVWLNAWVLAELEKTNEGQLARRRLMSWLFGGFAALVVLIVGVAFAWRPL